MNRKTQIYFGWLALVCSGIALLITLTHPFPGNQTAGFYVGTLIGPLSIVLLSTANILGPQHRASRMLGFIALPLAIGSLALILFSKKVG